MRCDRCGREEGEEGCVLHDTADFCDCYERALERIAEALGVPLNLRVPCEQLLDAIHVLRRDHDRWFKRMQKLEARQALIEAALKFGE